MPPRNPPPHRRTASRGRSNAPRPPRRAHRSDSIPKEQERAGFADGGSVQQTFLRHAAHDVETLIRYAWNAPMNSDPPELPPALKAVMREEFLRQLRETSSFDTYELELFQWYVSETEQLLETMLEGEQQFIAEQVDAGREDINDSGIVAVEYYIKRIRYSHVIYMASLLEIFLERECTRLTRALEPASIPFGIREIKGDQWSTKRKYLERYGRFQIPDSMWSSVSDVTTLRNALVHDNGVVDDIPREDRQRLQSCPGISLSGAEISIEVEFIQHGFEKMKELVQFVSSKVAETLDRAIKPRSLQ